MMYESQFSLKKNGPYDWFCGPWSQTISTQKLLENFTIDYKEIASNRIKHETFKKDWSSIFLQNVLHQALVYLNFQKNILTV